MLGGFFEVMEKLLRGGETGAAVLDDALSLSHGLSGRGVGHPHFNGKAALIRNTEEQQADGIRDG